MVSIFSGLNEGQDRIPLFFASRYTDTKVGSLSSGLVGGGVVRKWQRQMPVQSWPDLWQA